MAALIFRTHMRKPSQQEIDALVVTLMARDDAVQHLYRLADKLTGNDSAQARRLIATIEQEYAATIKLFGTSKKGIQRVIDTMVVRSENAVQVMHRELGGKIDEILHPGGPIGF